MVKATWSVVRYNLRRRSVCALLILPLLASLFVLVNITREANYRSGDPAGRRQLIEEAVQDGRLTRAEADANLELLHAQISNNVEQQQILVAPRSVQLSAQAMVTGGSLFALLLGVIVVGTTFSSGFMQTAVGLGSRTRLIVPFFGSYLILWGIVTVSMTVLALIVGWLTPSFLVLSKEVELVHQWSATGDVVLAVLGVWISGIAWAAIGGGLAVLSRSIVAAIIVGFVIWIGENLLGSLTDIGGWLPTFGAAEAVSVNAPKSLHGFFLFTTAHPPNHPSVPMAFILMLVSGALVAAVGVWKFRSADLT